MNQIPLTSSPGTRKGDMIYRTLGRTGEQVSAIGMGGYHIGQHGLTEEGSIRLIRSAIDHGITFMDNSWDYNEGQSETRMGKALKDGYRQKVFLMTKIDGRTKEVAERQIETSLERLQTDHIDLVQHHEIIRFDDPDRIFAVGGAMEAVVEAKKAGKIRYIGFTGHKDPHIHLYTLKVAADHGFHFDTVQMPALRAEPSDLGCDHGDRKAGNSRPGDRSREDLQADESRRSGAIACQNERGGDGREVRTVQDLVALRLDGKASGLARRGHSRSAGAGAERVARADKSAVHVR